MPRATYRAISALLTLAAGIILSTTPIGCHAQLKHMRARARGNGGTDGRQKHLGEAHVSFDTSAPGGSSAAGVFYAGGADGGGDVVDDRGAGEATFLAHGGHGGLPAALAPIPVSLGAHFGSAAGGTGAGVSGMGEGSFDKSLAAIRAKRGIILFTHIRRAGGTVLEDYVLKPFIKAQGNEQHT